MGPPLSAKQRRPQSVAMELRGLRWPRPTKMNVTTFDPVPGGRDKPLYSPISGSCFSRSAIQSPRAREVILRGAGRDAGVAADAGVEIDHHAPGVGAVDSGGSRYRLGCFRSGLWLAASAGLTSRTKSNPSMRWCSWVTASVSRVPSLCRLPLVCQGVEIILLSEQDDQINPAGVKGLGELGNVGTNAAVCNAVFHATGQRICNLPVRLEKLAI